MPMTRMNSEPEITRVSSSSTAQRNSMSPNLTVPSSIEWRIGPLRGAGASATTSDMTCTSSEHARDSTRCTSYVQRLNWVCGAHGAKAADLVAERRVARAVGEAEEVRLPYGKRVVIAVPRLSALHSG